jgi:hypothetical protein
MMENGEGVKRCTEKKDLSSGLAELGEGRARAIRVIERVISGEPLGLGTHGGH